MDHFCTATTTERLIQAEIDALLGSETYVASEGTRRLQRAVGVLLAQTEGVE